MLFVFLFSQISIAFFLSYLIFLFFIFTLTVCRRYTHTIRVHTSSLFAFSLCKASKFVRAMSCKNAFAQFRTTPKCLGFLLSQALVLVAFSWCLPPFLDIFHKKGAPKESPILCITLLFKCNRPILTLGWRACAFTLSFN